MLIRTVCAYLAFLVFQIAKCQLFNPSLLGNNWKYMTIAIILPDEDYIEDLQRERCFNSKMFTPILNAKYALDVVNIRMALEGFDRNIRFNVSINPTLCTDTQGIWSAAKLYMENKVNIFYGPCCKFALGAVAKLASQVWNIPIISPGGLSPQFSYKKDFPLLTRIIPPHHKTAIALREIIGHFNFSHTSVIYHDYISTRGLGTSECSQIAKTIRTNFPKKAYRSSVSLKKPHMEEFDLTIDLDKYNWAEIFGVIKNHSRGKVEDLKLSRARKHEFMHILVIILSVFNVQYGTKNVFLILMQ